MQTSRKTWWAALTLTLAAAWAAPAGAAPAGGKLERFEAGKWLTENAQVVTVVNVRQILEAPIMKKGGLEDAKALLKKNEQIATVLQAAGIDPLKDVETVLASATLGGGKDLKALVVVRGRYDLAKAQDAAAAFAKKNPEKLTVDKDGATNLYQFKAKDPVRGKQVPMVAAFADKSTLVITPAKESTLAAVRNGGKKEVAVSKELTVAMGKFTGKEGLAVAMVFTDELKKALARAPQAADVATKIDGITGTVNLTDAIDVAFVVGTSEAKAATKLEQLLEQGQLFVAFAVANDDGLAPLADIVNAIKIKADSSNVNVNLKVTAAMAQKVKNGGKDK
jgi:hypothetical protein